MHFELFSLIDWVAFIVITINITYTFWAKGEDKIVALLWAILLTIPLYAKYY